MTVNLAWRTAMASTNSAGVFGFDETKEPGFAERLPLELVTAFQVDYRSPELLASGRYDPAPGKLFGAFFGHMKSACKSGALACTQAPCPAVSGHAILLVSAHDFAAWLAAQGEEPSPHIRAWFKANGVTPTAAPTAPETKEERQDRRLQACIDVGLPMENTRAVLHKMPDGIGRVAQQFGVTRQAFTADVKGALERRLTIEQGRRPR